MSKGAVDKLSRLLEVEREALLSGDLATVGELVGEKEELAKTIEASNPKELRALSFALARNSALISAAKDGVADVMSTLRKQREARTLLSTYDSSGKPSQISGKSTATERRF